jgi:hypothetical protein
MRRDERALPYALPPCNRTIRAKPVQPFCCCSPSSLGCPRASSRSTSVPETDAFSVQWVTDYYRLPRGKETALLDVWLGGFGASLLDYGVDQYGVRFERVCPTELAHVVLLLRILGTCVWGSSGCLARVPGESVLGSLSGLGMGGLW